LIWDNTNKRLGIGTGSPGGRLHAAGADGDMIGILSGTTKAVRFFTQPGYSALQSMDNALSSFQPLYVDANTLALQAGGGGNVGIGTTGPAGKLHVSSGNSDVIALVNGATRAVRFGANTVAGTIDGVDVTGSASYQPLGLGGSYVYVNNNGVEAMRVTGGNVGIGTTPGYKLHVASGGTDILTVDPGGIVANTSVVPKTTNALLCGASGLAWSVVWAYAHSTASDPSLKTDIAAAPDGALDRVMDIEPKTFRWKDKPEGARHRGFLSTDVRRVMGPDFAGVIHDEETGLEGIEGLEMTSLLWKAVQELTAKVATLEATPLLIKAIQDLKQEVDDLRTQLVPGAAP
jgi:hypothetical protein